MGVRGSGFGVRGSGLGVRGRRTAMKRRALTVLDESRSVRSRSTRVAGAGGLALEGKG